ncbi:MAG: hypothetical protein M1837_002383 [Sclerophora amabilis]|nr:MAG: hypothetical protein M1837_002383 [Sclerophora amabilis]
MMLLSSRLILLQTVFLVHLTLTSGTYLRRDAPGIRGRADTAFSDRPADLDSSRTLSTRVHGPQPIVNLIERTKTKTKSKRGPNLHFHPQPGPESESEPESEPDIVVQIPRREPADNAWSEDNDFTSKYEDEKDVDISLLKFDDTREQLADEAFEFFTDRHWDFAQQNWLMRWRQEEGGTDWLYVYYEVTAYGPREERNPEVDPTHWYMDETYEDDTGETRAKWVPDHLYDLINNEEKRLPKGSVKMSLVGYTWHAGFFTEYTDVVSDSDSSDGDTDSDAD